MDSYAFIVMYVLAIISMILTSIGIIVNYYYDDDTLLAISGFTTLTASVCGIYGIVVLLLTT